MNIQESIINNFAKNLLNKFDDILIEGLKLKGFEFSSRKEINQFINEGNITCIDNRNEQQKIFYVKGIPFLLHEYKSVVSHMVIVNNCPTIRGEYGSYAYL